MAGFRDNHYHYMFTAAQVIIPTRKQPGIAEPRTATDLVRIGKRDGDSIAICGQQIRVTFCDMQFAFFAKLH